MSKYRLEEGLIEVPKAWIQDFKKDATTYFANIVTVKWYAGIHALYREIKQMQENMEMKDLSDSMMNTFANAIIKKEDQIERGKADLQKFVWFYGCYIPDSKVSLLTFDEEEFSNFNNDDIREFYWAVDPDPKDFKQYKIDNNVKLQRLQLEMIMENAGSIKGEFLSRENYAKIYLTGSHFWNIIGSAYDNYEIREAEKIVKDLVNAYVITFEHEAMHYIQLFVLPAKYFYDQIDEIEYKKLGKGYVSSKLEFQPQIISAYGRYLKFNDANSEEENLRLFIEQDKFFILLDVGSKQWKEAVKLLYLLIVERLEEK